MIPDEKHSLLTRDCVRSVYHHVPEMQAHLPKRKETHKGSPEWMVACPDHGLRPYIEDEVLDSEEQCLNDKQRNSYRVAVFQFHGLQHPEHDD